MTPTERPTYRDAPPTSENPFLSPGGPGGMGDRAPAPLAPAGKPAVEETSLPVDPMRIVWALRRRWHWLLFGAAAGLLLGAGFGAIRVHTRYEATFQLIKRYSPPTLQAGANGEPYKPRQFTNSTLASAAASSNVMERVARKARPPVSARDLKLAINVKEDKLTDFLTLTISGHASPEATVALARNWSEEIISFTREIQSQESGEIRKVIQSQIDANQGELQNINGQLSKFSGGGALLGIDSQAESFVKLQDDIDSRYDAARIELDGLTSELAGLKTELLRHTPAAEELRQARAELSAFQARYTDKNPLVIERQEKIAALEAQLKKQQESSVALDLSDLNNHSGTAIGDQLYMRMVEMDNQRAAAERRAQELGRQHDLFAKSPEKVSQILELLQRKQMLRVAQTLLLGRLQEVRIYEENAPAYYGVYAPADLDQIVVSRKMTKVALLGVGGAVAGTCGTLGLVLLLGIADRKLRTPGEAAKAVGAPLLATVAGGGKRSAAADEATAAKLWTRWLGGQGEARRLRAVWCAAGQAGEDDFWRLMLAQAQRLLPGLLVIDSGPTVVPALADLPRGSLHEWQRGVPFALVHCPLANSSLTQVRDLQYFIESRLTEGLEVWLRLVGPVREPAVGVVRAAGAAPLFLASLHDTTTGAFLKEQAELLRHVGVAPCGVVATNDGVSPMTA